MRRIAMGLVIGSLVLGGMVLPAEARGWRHRHHGRYHGHGQFFGGFLAGAGTVLLFDALTTPRVIYAPRVVYGPPVVYEAPLYYRAPVCRDTWIPERWETRARQQNGFTTYYQVLVPGTWARQCY